MSEALLWIGAWSMILWGTAMLRGDLLEKSWAKVLFLPGLCLEAVLRLVSCLVTATPIQGLYPLRRGKPFLQTGKSPMHYLGAPIAVTVRIFLLFGLTYSVLLNFPDFLESRFTLPEFGGGITDLPTVSEFASGVTALPEDLELESPVAIFAVYTLFTCLIALGLTSWEYFGALGVWVGLILIAQGASWLGLRIAFFSRGTFIRWFYGDEFWATFSLLVFLSLLGAACLALRILLVNFFKSGPPTPVAAPGS